MQINPLNHEIMSLWQTHTSVQ